MSSTLILPPACLTAAKKLPKMSSSQHNILTHPDLDTDKIVHLIETDPLLLAYILKIANSSFFGHSRQIETSHDSVIILGRTAIASICSMNLMKTLSTVTTKQFNTDLFLQHSVLVACLASEAALHCKTSADIAFSAGLLHGIGELLAILSGGNYEKTFEELGAALLQYWGLPQTIVEAILYSTQPIIESPLSLAVSFGRKASAIKDTQLKNQMITPFQDQILYDQAIIHAKERCKLLMDANK